MGELFRIVVDSIQFLWPLRIVEEWEGGGYYVFGRWLRPLRPGMYPIVPFFTDVKTVSLAEGIIGTGRQDITLADGTVFSFEAKAPVRVVDPYLALNKVNDYEETCQEALCSVLADRLWDVDVGRLDRASRRRLITDLNRWVNEELKDYGVYARKLSFTSFLTNVRTHRLLVDQSPLPLKTYL